jgi:hypothetical protein
MDTDCEGKWCVSISSGNKSRRFMSNLGGGRLDLEDGACAE